MPPKRNGFMVFTLDWKNKYGRHMSISDATEQAGKIWKDMDAAARAPYNQRAKQEKRGAPMKLTCTGKAVTEVEREKLEVEQKERQIKRYIETTVRNCIKDDTLTTQKYYFIMANYFAKTLTGGYYVPAEISVSEFSLKDGVGKIYHSLINPGGPIFGHQYEAKHHADNTHNLPLPPKAMGTTDLGKVYNDILELICDEETGEYPPVYTHFESLPIIESVLNYFKSDSTSKYVDLKVYSIQYLMFILKDAACEIGETEKITSHHIIDAHFSNDYFEYEPGISCQFHEECDKSKYCTKSCVTRWGYMFADMMCSDLAINLIPGRHCPIKTNLSAIMSITIPKPSGPNNAKKSSHASDRKNLQSYSNILAKSKDNESEISFDAAEGSICYSNQTRSNIRYDDEDYDNEFPESLQHNPRSSRARVVTREPELSSFDVGLPSRRNGSDVNESVVSSGYGRGSSINTSWGRGWGRGRGRTFD